MHAPRSVLRSLLEGLFSDLSAPPPPEPPRPRRTVVGTRVGELIGPEARRAPVATPLIFEDLTATRVSASRSAVFLGLALLVLLAWFSTGGRRGFAAIATPVNLPVLTRCSGLKELELALAQVRSAGLTRGTVRIRAGSLWEPGAGPIRIQVGEETSAAPAPAPGRDDVHPVFSASFPAAPVHLELTVPGEPVPEGLFRRAPTSEPVSLIRDRARERGLELHLERLSGGQVTALPVDGARSLWEYGIRATGSGPAAAFRQFLADLDGTEWMLHVDDLELSFDEARAQFTLQGRLLSGGEDAAGGPALAIGERRLAPLEPGEEVAVLPRDAVSVARLGRHLAVVTARKAGPVTISLGGPDSARDVALTIVAPDRPLATGPREPVSASRPPAFPHLLGTSAAESGARALFTEKDAREGDKVGAFRVDQVLEDGVRLTWNGRKFYLPMNGPAREEVELAE